MAFSIGIYILVCVMILVFVVVFVLAAIWTAQNNQCATAPNPWCYWDWQCSDGASGYTNMSDKFKQLLVNCDALTQEQVDAKYTKCQHLDTDGKPVCDGTDPVNCPANPNLGTTGRDPPRPTKCYIMGDIDFDVCVAASWWTGAV